MKLEVRSRILFDISISTVRGDEERERTVSHDLRNIGQDADPICKAVRDRRASLWNLEIELIDQSLCDRVCHSRGVLPLEDIHSPLPNQVLA